MSQNCGSYLDDSNFCASMARRSKRIQNRIDRISELPECILHHILSFVDTRSSVRTSVLSKRWTSVWKYVPALDFSRGKSRSFRRFERQVDRVLSLRSDSIGLIRVAADSITEERMKDVFERIMNYAASHGVQELSLRVNRYRALDVTRLVCASSRSLQVLKLDRAYINLGLLSGLQLLKSLTLSQCSFEAGDGAHTAFTNFPILESLKLDDCSTRIYVTVNGPNLLNLEIVSAKLVRLEIHAPKLQSFTLKTNHSVYTLPEVSKSNLPSLSRANIELMKHMHLFLPADGTNENASERQLLLERCVNLFKVLHNVQVLNLQVETLELLIQACNSVEHQSSPFKRTKSVNLKFCEGSSSDISDQVIRFFVGDSPYEEGKILTAKKIYRPRFW
ncbi:Putative F-box/LRR-repeat protein At5g02700 [Linum grandiflorum]